MDEWVLRIGRLTPDQRTRLAEKLNAGSSGDRLLAYVETDVGNLKLENLKRQLVDRLPAYMVPSSIIPLNEIPRLPNGKIDRSTLALSAIHPHGESLKAECPRTSVERLLVEIWEEVLGFSPIGTKDNFFEIGGDSILIIRVVGRARKEGVILAPNDLFDHPTIELLARVAGTKIISESMLPESGPAGLHPIQSWFFNEHQASPSHWHQAVSFVLTRPIESEQIREAAGTMVAHHEALRLRFEVGDSRWSGLVAAPEDVIPFESVDLSGVTPEKWNDALNEALRSLASSCVLSRGSLFKIIEVKTPDGVPGCLVMMAHHLVCDAVSWDILVEDLSLLLASPMAKLLPSKTSSWRHWCRHLESLVTPSGVENDLEFWRRQEVECPLPMRTDFEVELPLTEKDVETLTSSVSQVETRRLVEQVPAAYQTQTDEILVMALLQALGSGRISFSACLGLERHGRNLPGDHPDVSRTVGWFTAFFPLRLDWPDSDDLSQIIKNLKEQIRAVPSNGVSYGMLRYGGTSDEQRDRHLVRRPSVTFNFLGQLEDQGKQDWCDRREFLSVGMRSADSERFRLLEINAMMVNGELKMLWTYNRSAFRESTIQQLMDGFGTALLSLVEHCASKQGSDYTPSDFPEAGLGQDDLDQLLGEIDL